MDYLQQLILIKLKTNMTYISNTFPTAIQTGTDPIGTDGMSTFDHAGLESFQNDSILALKNKVGVDSSAVNTSHDYKLSGVSTGDKAVSKTGTETLTNKTISSPQINFGSDANGDIIIRNGSGVTSRLAVGTSGQILNVDAGTGLPAWVSNPSAADASYSTAGVATIDANVRFYAADTSASSTAYTATLSPVPSAYVTGQTFRIKFINANTTTTPTLNLNGLGAKTIVKGVSTALAVGDITANMIGTVSYDGTNFVLQNPAGVLATSTNWHLTTSVVASATNRTSDDASVNITSASYTKVKEILYNDVSGTLRITYTVAITSGSGSHIPTTRIYKNGIAYGTERTTTASFSEDLAFVTGDLIQLYEYLGAGGGGSDTYAATNFRVSYDKTTAFTSDYTTNTVNL